MAPRARLASDADILAGALRAITRLGPARLTLADVAEEAGISAAAVVQRFGCSIGPFIARARWRRGSGGISRPCSGRIAWGGRVAGAARDRRARERGADKRIDPQISPIHPC
jgi:hypothetical protein